MTSLRARNESTVLEYPVCSICSIAGRLEHHWISEPADSQARPSTTHLKSRKLTTDAFERHPEFGRFYGVWMVKKISNAEINLIHHWREANEGYSMSLLVSQPVFLTTETSLVGSCSNTVSG